MCVTCSTVLNHLVAKGLLDNGLKFRSMFLPDRFVDHGSQKQQLKEVGLTPENISDMAEFLLDRPEAPVVINVPSKSAEKAYSPPGGNGNS